MRNKLMADGLIVLDSLDSDGVHSRFAALNASDRIAF